MMTDPLPQLKDPNLKALSGLDDILTKDLTTPDSASYLFWPGIPERFPAWISTVSLPIHEIVRDITSQMLKNAELKLEIARICQIDSGSLEPKRRKSFKPRFHRIEGDRLQIILVMEKFVFELYVDAWLHDAYHGPNDGRPYSMNKALASIKGRFKSDASFDKLEMEDMRELALKWHEKQKTSANCFLNALWTACHLCQVPETKAHESLFESFPDRGLFIRDSEALRLLKERLVELRRPIVAIEAI